MTAKNPKAGRGPCPTCGESVLYRKSPVSHKLHFTCDNCDSSGFADPGGLAHKRWSASIKPETAPEQQPSPAPAPSPAPRRPAQALDLGQL